MNKAIFMEKNKFYKVLLEMLVQRYKCFFPVFFVILCFLHFLKQEALIFLDHRDVSTLACNNVAVLL